MNSALRIAIASFLGLAFYTPARGTFIISEWNLSSGVHDFHNDLLDGHTFTQVISPFVGSHTASVPPSTATANYNFVFDDFSASFNTTAAHQALDVPPSGLFSASGGSITIQTTQDLLVSVTGFYNYALPPNLFAADLRASVRNTNTAQLLWGQDPTANSFGGSFVSGTLHVDTPAGGVLVPGGATYTISYTMMLRTFGGGTNAIGTGNGEIQWDIQVVPECTALSLFMPALALVVRRRRRR